MRHPLQMLQDRSAGLLPGRGDYAGLRTSWRVDLVAGLTVGVVALPLALGFGVASGVGPTAGIVTAIVAGIVAAVFGGSSVQVSGPTGAMAVVLAPIVAHDGARSVAAVAVIAGVMVLLMGVAGLGRLVRFVPWPVLEGFTVGIAVTIGLQQVPLLLGLSKPGGTGVLDSAWVAVQGATAAQAEGSLVIGALVVATMLVWPRLTHRVPGSIVAVVLATAVTWIFHLDVPLIGALPHHLPAPGIPFTGSTHVGQLLGPALAVATLAAIESLLSARVADTMTGTGTTSDGRELVGQGLANVAAGLFGGMPATGAIARTAVNVRAGARTRLAAITHSLVIVVVILAAAPVVSHVPLAALGAVLLMTAVRMIDHVRVFVVVRSHVSEAVVLVATAVVTVAVDLVTAIEIGLLLAGILALRKMASSSIASAEELARHDHDTVDEHELLTEHIAVYRLDGALFFGAVPAFLESFDVGPDVSVVILRLSGLTMLDATGADALASVIDALEARGITVLVKGARDEHGRMLGAVGIVASLADKGHVFDDLPTAVAHARRHVMRTVGLGDVGAA